jgi:hypothetical protein
MLINSSKNKIFCSKFCTETPLLTIVASFHVVTMVTFSDKGHNCQHYFSRVELIYKM